MKKILVIIIVLVAITGGVFFYPKSYLGFSAIKNSTDVYINKCFGFSKEKYYPNNVTKDICYGWITKHRTQVAY